MPLLIGVVAYVIKTEKMRHTPTEYTNIVVETVDSGKYTIRTDGSTNTDNLLPIDLGSESEWSPDGEWIVSTTKHYETGVLQNFQSDIYIMKADGSQRTRIPAPKNSFAPTWSPDGTRIAYYYEERYEYGIHNTEKGIAVTDVECIIRMKKCEPDSFILNQRVAHLPTDKLDWSPDGRQIVYTGEVRINSDYTVIGHTFVVDVSRQNSPIDLTPDSSYLVVGPSWSPDGTKILNLCIDNINHEISRNICVMNRDGSNRKYFDIPSELDYLSTPSWSPDGGWIAFIADDMSKSPVRYPFCWGNCYQPQFLIIMNADGGDLTRIKLDNDQKTIWFTWYPFK